MLRISRPLYLISLLQRKEIFDDKTNLGPIIPRPPVIFLLQTSDPMPEAVSASA